MSCKCFDKTPIFKNSDPFDDKLAASKCKCSSRFSVNENKSKFTIVPEDIDKVTKIKIDDYFDRSPAYRKCDYLFVYTSGTNHIHIFVELKGSDITHAITQIGNTIDIFYRQGRLSNEKVIGAIVCSKYPSHDGTYRKAKLTLEKHLSSKIRGFRIEKKSRVMTYDSLTDKVI